MNGAEMDPRADVAAARARLFPLVRLAVSAAPGGRLTRVDLDDMAATMAAPQLGDALTLLDEMTKLGELTYTPDTTGGYWEAAS